MATTFKLDKAGLLAALTTTLAAKRIELDNLLKEQAEWEANAGKRQAAHKAALVAWRTKVLKAILKDPTMDVTADPYVGFYRRTIWGPMGERIPTCEFTITVKAEVAGEFPEAPEDKRFFPAPLRQQVTELEQLIKMINLTTTDTVSSSLVTKFQQYL